MNTSTDDRLQHLHSWLIDCLAVTDYQLQPASGDASFRRYFRLNHNGYSYIVMDAPPEKEDSKPFVSISRALINIGLNAPDVIEQDLDQGFLLLTDLGKKQYLDVLTKENVDRLYGDAMGALLSLQACGAAQCNFPLYDSDLLKSEMALFPDWLIGKHLNIQLSNDDRKILDDAFSILAESAQRQPQVPVHRDYHSRNLMFDETHNPGILDFQDAVIGPVTYDLVSLLRDCYIEWPREQIEAWVSGYHDLAVESGILKDENEAQFLRWFDLMGVQRHLKAAGIFARLNYRDNKPGYLADIPRTVGYII
ncbi:MAG: phosphotransferase, partial [Gammaproteobacteria bacterium]|nr:phosphotransferase [Gammaproteobacteria bacterium]